MFEKYSSGYANSNVEVLRHLNAILFDTRVHDKWSFEQLPMVQRIMNTVEKTSTGVSPAELILNNSIRLTERILLPPTQAKSSGQFALSDTVDEWVARQSTLVRVARDKQLQTDFHALVEFDPSITEYPVNSYVSSLLQSVEATSCYPASEARTK